MNRSMLLASQRTSEKTARYSDITDEAEIDEAAEARHAPTSAAGVVMETVADRCALTIAGGGPESSSTSKHLQR